MSKQVIGTSHEALRERILLAACATLNCCGLIECELQHNRWMIIHRASGNHWYVEVSGEDFIFTPRLARSKYEWQADRGHLYA